MGHNNFLNIKKKLKPTLTSEITLQVLKDKDVAKRSRE